MRKLIFGTNITLDGCCDHTKGIANTDVHEYFTDRIREADLLVYGRKTYQLMVPYWPDVAKHDSGATAAINEFAKVFDSKKKIVFSQTLKEVDDKNTTVIHTNLEDEIVKLKQEPGKSILVGGVSLPSQLIELGLVDEYCFVIHPVIAGEGTRLLEDIKLHEQQLLTLVESKIFDTGYVALRYAKQ